MKYFSISLTAGLLLASPLAAGEFDFDPGAPCAESLNTTSQSEIYQIAMWASGYTAARTGVADEMSSMPMNAAYAALKARCDSSPNASIVNLLEANYPAQSAESTAPALPDPEALLRQFLLPSADYGALTLQLRPTEADIRAIYDAPMAEPLLAFYDEMYNYVAESGNGIEPKPDQNDLYIVATTTNELARNPDIQQQFPGGYMDVIPHFSADVPIVKFSFVKAGETSGRSFDGLVYVNNHWVLMPKPWKAL